MADNVTVTPSGSTPVATDEVGGIHFQKTKLIDPTPDSTDPIGVPDNPMTVDARLVFKDYTDTYVEVEDNENLLPVFIGNSVNLTVASVLGTVQTTVSESYSDLTGPSNGTWGSTMAFPGRTGMTLSVKSTGGTPTVAAFGAAAIDGTYDQQLPLVVPDGDSLVLAETFTPGVGARFCYILATPPFVEIRATSGGTATAVDATLSGGPLPPSIVATVGTGGASGDTELPAAAALADAASNATTPTVGAAHLFYNGSTWDRARGDTGNGLDVDVTRVIPGTSATHLGKAEDAAHTSGDTGVMGLGVRRADTDSLTALAGADNDYIPLTTDTRGVLQVIARPVVSRIRVASSGLTTASTTYAVGDTAGAIMTFAGAAKVTGGTGTILSATLLDKGDVGVDYRLHIYRVSVTLASDNVAWAVSDSDQESLIGILTMPSMLDIGANRVSTLANIGLAYDCNATSLFVGVETRTANAVYAAATDLHLILTVALD